MKLKVPYLKWRAGRPRWEPGPTLRAKGWKGRDLKNEVGDWLDLPAAIEAAHGLNAELVAWRAAGGVKRRPPVPMRPSRTCEHLWELWRVSPKFQNKAASTKRDYANKMKPFIAEFGDKHVGALESSHLYNWWEELYEERGHHMANGIIAVVRAMFSYGKNKGWRADNPARELGLETPQPRQMLWLPAEIDAIVAKADALGVPSVADAVIIAVHTSQRQGDVLAMPRRIFVEKRVRLSQLKMRSRGGALIDIKMTPQLAARMTAIIARKKGNVIDPDEPLVLREDTGGPYDVHAYRKAFRRVREAAVQDCPSLADKRFQDLRDTAVTRLALARNTMAEIAAVTGHSPESITKIIKHYLVLQPEMADVAIDNLSQWLEDQGIVL